MAQQSRWRAKAQRVIAEVLRAEGVQLGPTLPYERARAVYQKVNAAYPWCEKRNHPYTVWLSEMKLLRQALRLEPQEAPKPKPEPEPRPIDPNQMGLFGDHDDA